MNREIQRRRLRMAISPDGGDTLHCTALGEGWAEMVTFTAYEITATHVWAQVATNRDDPDDCTGDGEPLGPFVLAFPLADPGDEWWSWSRLVRRANATEESPDQEGR